MHSTFCFLEHVTQFYDKKLVNKVTPVFQPSLNVLLFGSQELSNSANKQICLAVQDYLVKYKSFEVNNN